MDALKYKRILLKLSGESLCEKGGFGIDGEQAKATAQRILEICKAGAQVSIVVGGGNLLRGAAFSQEAKLIPRATADYMGMLATVMNATALCETLKSIGQPAKVLSAIPVEAINEPFVREKAISYLEEGQVIILAGGTGNPFFSTDTCAALRACQIEADMIVKATKVDGVYTADPMKDPSAELIKKITYQDIVSKDLKVIDHAAMTLCRENNIPVRVLNMFKGDDIIRAVKGEDIGTIISDNG
ncbi:MAG: UMP kinase [Sedimentisphaeraceae bacterium JB056]